MIGDLVGLGYTAAKLYTKANGNHVSLANVTGQDIARPRMMGGGVYSPYSSAISTNVFCPSLARILAILSPILFYATANRGSVVNECMTFTHSNRLPRGCVPRVYVKICVCTTKLWYFEAWYFQI